MLEIIGLVTLIVIVTLVLWVLSLSVLSYFWGSPYIPSNSNVIKKFLDATDIQEGTVFFDLGSGDGRVLIEAAKRGALAIGYELNPFWYLISKLRVSMNGLSEKISIYRQDIFDAKFNEADVIYIYLYPKIVAQLEEELKEKTRKGTKIISYKLPFISWKEYKTFKNENIFIYINK